MIILHVDIFYYLNFCTTPKSVEIVKIKILNISKSLDKNKLMNKQKNKIRNLLKVGLKFDSIANYKQIKN